VKVETKQKILEAGARIIHRKGFHHTGIQEVLAAADVPKGSFYFYFKNKEDFGLQVVDYFNGMFRAMADPIVNDTQTRPLIRMERLLNHFIALFDSLQCTCGCPIGNLAQEMGDLSDAFSQRLRQSLDMMAGIYAKLIKEAQSDGEIMACLDVTRIAYFIVSSWHGALIQMKIVRGLEPLENHKHFVMGALMQPGR
jgi:TetR/AcrR family transcriptional regulator, transcriptional repressor for nem operon